MNKKLKFSGGHIVAFVAIIFTAYVSFLGLTFLSSGRFFFAAIGSLIVVAILIACFIGAQMLKATEKGFDKKISRERALVFATPFVFIVVMLPFSHFWTVHSHQDQVVQDFTKAVAMSENVFSEYENYANDRVDNYQTMLNDVVSKRSSNYKDYKACGFNGTPINDNNQPYSRKGDKRIIRKTDKSTYQQPNNPKSEDSLMVKTMVNTLRVQLLSQNYDDLSREARKWISSASHGISTWNVFLIGNIRQIDKALIQWQTHLADFSSRKISNEEFKGKVQSFDHVSTTIGDARKILNSVNNVYRDFGFPSITAIIFMLLVYLALFMPYYIQPRNTKSRFGFWGLKNKGLQDAIDSQVLQLQQNQTSNTSNVDEEPPQVELGINLTNLD